MTPEDLALNEYVVTNQWVYPTVESGKRLDIVLLINGFPVVIGELKTPVRDAISWLDAAGDIAAYEKVFHKCLFLIFLTLPQRENVFVMARLKCLSAFGDPGIHHFIKQKVL